MTKKRMPPLMMDEVILLVDTYYYLQDVDNKEEKDELIEELSKSMRALPFYRDYVEDPTFRSVDGMKMCLANVAWADPQTSSSFGHGSKTQRIVLSYYENNKKLLHLYALAIKKLSGEQFPILEGYKNFIAGMLLPSYHRYLEINNKTVSAMLKEARAQHQTRCRICGLDLKDVYGSESSELLEMHLDMPLEYNKPGIVLSPSDLILICPTCHKLAHKNPVLFESEKLQCTLKAGM